ncbi:GspMb/PilO family protein [Roseateles paludis]|jgi:hypothetical protein|uniref:GspMb/PilO family protein n=1 Tax=Roseateles paludis TaxID=3145238 RepID=A0ABV0G6E9_9BURK
MTPDTVQVQLAQLRSQWEESGLIRLGLWAALGTLCLYAVLAGFDAADAAVERSQGLRAEIQRFRSLTKDQEWPRRQEEVLGLRAAYDTTVWSEADLALSEAALQDWLRNAAQKLGLKLRDLAVVRAEADAKSASDLPAGYVVLRVRMSLEMQRTPLLSLLAEIGRQERRIVVERLTMRTLSQPATADIDLRVLARPGAAP